MNKTASRNQRRLWGVHLRLLFAIVSLTIFTAQTKCVISFNCCNYDRITLHRRSQKFIERQDSFDRDFSILATITEVVDDDNKPPKSIDTSSPSRSNTRIVFPGGGIFFYYQAGLVNFLREGYDLSTCSFSGASAGALTATLTAADVDFYEATELALKLAADSGVWDRSGGLQGIWGPLIEEWLDSLLPTSIESLEDRITLLVTPIPSFGKTKVSSFEDRNDLIRCNMASVHLPWFLDGKLTSNFRDRPHIDGSFLSKEEDYIPDFDRDSESSTETIFLDWSKDAEMSSKGGFDIVEALSPEGIYGLMERGKLYGKIMEEQGMFDSLVKRL